MSKQRKTASAMSVCQYLAAGVTGTAMVGVGVLLTVPPDKPAPTTAEVKLANTEAECVPDTPGCDSAALGASLGVDSFATPGTTAIFFGAIGSGGWLIGDGLSWDEIDATCTELCNGGNGGLFGGSGGDGAFGGTGGNAGFFWGSGGDGGDGLDAVYGADPASPRPARREAQRGDPRRRRRQCFLPLRQRRSRRRRRLGPKPHRRPCTWRHRHQRLRRSRRHRRQRRFALWRRRHRRRRRPGRVAHRGHRRRW